MDWEDKLKYYQTNERISDEELLGEAIATNEDYFDFMNKDELFHRSRPLVLSYLALKQMERTKVRTTLLRPNHINKKEVASLLYSLETIGVSTDHQHYKVVEELREEQLKLEEIRKMYKRYEDALGTGDDFVHLMDEIKDVIERG